jgi:truncated hemoglobin YjbI
MQHYGSTSVAGERAGGPPTLYEWAGGEEAFRRLFEHFYRAVQDDELLAPVFATMDAAHAAHVATWLAEVFGGPTDYTASLGGYEAMLRHHLGRGITERQRRRWVWLLQDAADAVGLPGDPEFRAAFVGYLEWGSRLALHNSQPGADVVSQAPVPRWGWGVAPPWQPAGSPAEGDDAEG